MRVVLGDFLELMLNLFRLFFLNVIFRAFGAVRVDCIGSRSLFFEQCVFLLDYFVDGLVTLQRDSAGIFLLWLLRLLR